MKTKKIPIQGMHCASCEKLLHDEFLTIPGIIDARVNHRTNMAEINYADDIDLQQLAVAAKKYGYAVIEEGSDDACSSTGCTLKDWLLSLFIVVVLYVVYSFLQRLGIFSGLVSNDNNITWGVSLLTGIAASLSTCLLVVGAVVMAFGERYQSNGDDTFSKVIKPNIAFHVGRLATFFLLGGALGTIGGQLIISNGILAGITILVALVMVWLGLNTLGFLPSPTRFGLKIPEKFTGTYWANLRRSDSHWAPLLLGSLSFFLPCGFTQSMQLFALSSGSFWQGGMILFFFALGTTPVLFLLGTSASWVKSKRSIVLKRSIGIIMVLFAFYTFNTGWALKDIRTAGIGKNSETIVPSSDNNEAPNKNEIPSSQQQVVNMSITSSGFSPKKIPLKKDVPVKWMINGESVTGCTNEIVIPKLEISQKIKPGLNVVEFTPTEKGSLAFSCWMGMVRGEFVVE